VSEHEFRKQLEEVRAWGQWGADDEKGALNYITPAKRAQAAGLVRRGRAFSLAIPMRSGLGPQTGAGGRINPVRLMTATGCDPVSPIDLGMGARYIDDFLLMSVQSGTQWDALCHIYYGDKLYNGHPASSVDSAGARRNGIDKVHADFVSRGVLLDIARLKGVECLASAYAITIEDLEAAERRQGVRVQSGDILLVRTGQMSQTRGFSDWSVFHRPEAGLDWRTALWMRERQVAAVAGDNSMVEAAGQIPGIWVPFHMLALANLGIHLGEFWCFEELASDCEADGVWEFMLIAQALPLAGGAGSPLNPLALK
jgi:kynurenine formamidase